MVKTKRCLQSRGSEFAIDKLLVAKPCGLIVMSHDTMKPITPRWNDIERSPSHNFFALRAGRKELFSRSFPFLETMIIVAAIVGETKSARSLASRENIKLR